MYVNEFATAYWAQADKGERMEELRRLIETVTDALPPIVPEGMGFEEYFEKIWGTEQMSNAVTYGFFQMNSVRKAMEKETDLSAVLEKAEIRADMTAPMEVYQGEAGGAMKKKKRFTGFILVAVIALAVLAAICIFLLMKREGHSDKEILLDQLSEGGEYKFKGLEWGISAKEAEKYLPFDIELDKYKNEYEGPAGTTFYKAEQGVTLDGRSATATFEFQDDELAVVKFEFDFYEEQDYEQWFEALVAEMLRLYGEENRKLEKIGRAHV